MMRQLSCVSSFPNNKTRDEPIYRTVSRMTVLLRFVVLALVYKHIGVNDQAILSCKRKSIYSTMDESIRIILLHECQTKDVWNRLVEY